MKVCMLAYAFYLTDARIKAYVKSLEYKGIEIDIIALKEEFGKSKEQINTGMIYYLTEKYQGSNTLHYIFSYIKFFITALLKLSFLYLKNKYAVIHVHNMPNFIIFAAFIPRMLGARVILDVHDLMTVNYMAKFGVDDLYWLIRLLKFEQKLSALFADHVICADHFQKRTLTEYGIPKQKITVLMNLPNEEIFTRVHREKKEDKFNLIYHGTIAERLGIEVLLRAIALINDKIPVKLSIYGQGDSLKENLRLMRELKLEECVYFSESFFPVEKVSQIVSTMDVGIVPNRKNPATEKYMMPVKLMEYAYLQIPVIAPRLEIIKYYFNENMIKFFEPENADDLARCILELYENPKERDLLAKNASKFFEKYNWRSQEQTYLGLINAAG